MPGFLRRLACAIQIGPQPCARATGGKVVRQVLRGDAAHRVKLGGFRQHAHQCPNVACAQRARREDFHNIRARRQRCKHLARRHRPHAANQSRGFGSADQQRIGIGCHHQRRTTGDQRLQLFVVDHRPGTNMRSRTVVLLQQLHALLPVGRVGGHFDHFKPGLEQATGVLQDLCGCNTTQNSHQR